MNVKKIIIHILGQSNYDLIDIYKEKNKNRIHLFKFKCRLL